jgi:hypothetical protein
MLLSLATMLLPALNDMMTQSISVSVGTTGSLVISVPDATVYSVFQAQIGSKGSGDSISITPTYLGTDLNQISSFDCFSFTFKGTTGILGPNPTSHCLMSPAILLRREHLVLYSTTTTMPISVD